jgi:hypothetical protein
VTTTNEEKHDANRYAATKTPQGLLTVTPYLPVDKFAAVS